MLGIDVAKKYIGLNEVRNNTEIKSLLHSQAIHGDIAIDPATTSWCAAWINFCERESGHPGNGHLNAQSFETYGKDVADDDWKIGDIVVFHFSFDASWQGHVSYISSWNDGANTVTCLGGNQSNNVQLSTYNQDSIIKVRRSP